MIAHSVPVFVGLDYHRRSVQVCIMDRAGTVLFARSLPNDVPRLVQCVTRFGRVRRAAVESCSGAADLAECLADAAGWSVSLAHPGYVTRMKQNPDKSDYSDARMLADLCRVGYLPKVWLAPRPIRELRALVRFRQQWVQRRREAKTRLLALLRERRIAEPTGVGRWCRAWRVWLASAPDDLGEHGAWIAARHLEELDRAQAEIRIVQTRLRQATGHDATVQHLLAQPGIGEVTAWMLRAEIGRFDRFTTGKQLARFCGLTPRNASSGERVADAGLIRAGNPQLKAVLMQAGHRLRRHHPRWRELNQRLAARGKHVCVIVAAVANRWMRHLHHAMVRLEQETAMS